MILDLHLFVALCMGLFPYAALFFCLAGESGGSPAGGFRPYLRTKQGKA
jgi:hypothetical protein